MVARIAVIDFMMMFSLLILGLNGGSSGIPGTQSGRAALKRARFVTRAVPQSLCGLTLRMSKFILL